MNSSYPRPPFSGHAVSLNHFLMGDLGRITAIDSDIDLSQRLTALGLREGCQIRVLRKASFGGPLHVRVGTTELIMRRSEAQRIMAVPV